MSWSFWLDEVPEAIVRTPRRRGRHRALIPGVNNSFMSASFRHENTRARVNAIEKCLCEASRLWTKINTFSLLIFEYKTVTNNIVSSAFTFHVVINSCFYDVDLKCKIDVGAAPPTCW